MAEGDAAEQTAGERDSIGLFYEIARWRLDEQLERIKSLDNKLAVTFTLNSAVIALFGAALAFAAQEFAYHVWAFAVAVLGVYLVNLIFAWRAYRQKNWSVRPDLNELDRLIDSYPSIAIREWAAREIMVSLTHNEALLQEKGLDARIALATAIVDAALVGVTAIAATAPFA